LDFGCDSADTGKSEQRERRCAAERRFSRSAASKDVTHPMARGDEVRIPETPQSARRLRVVVAALVSVGLLVPLAALGAGTSGQTASAAQYKITICHHTHSKKHPFVTIRISNKAWPAHQRHGDTMGACATTQAKHGKGHHN